MKDIESYINIVFHKCPTQSNPIHVNGTDWVQPSSVNLFDQSIWSVGFGHADCNESVFMGQTKSLGIN